MTPVRDTFERTLASARSTVAFRETLRLAFESFRASKVRTMLTMLGMVIGAAAVILVATLGLTGREYAVNMIESIGPNMVHIEWQGGDVAGPNNVATPDLLTHEDENAILEQVPGIVASSPMIELHDNISIGNGIQRNAMMLGVSPQYKEVRNLKVLAGRFFDDQDEATHAKVGVINAPMAVQLFGSYAGAVDRTITLSGIPFTIIGVFKESVETFGQSEISTSDTVLMPYTVARYFTGTNTVKMIFFRVADSSQVEPAAAHILDVVKHRHRATSVYQVFTLTQVLSMMQKIATMLTIVLTLGAAITLVVSGVGIMNSMLANVQARIREIGIRKAMGATAREIRIQFLTESVFISVSGGVVGMLLGLALPLSVRFLTDFDIPISIWSPVIALTTSIAVGVIFGTLPAQRAAKLDPVETLKYE